MDKYKIVNIHRGKGKREHIIYAHLINEKGELLIAATLDYIVSQLQDKNRFGDL